MASSYAEGTTSSGGSGQDVLPLLQEMFTPQLEPDVVQMILTDCNYNVNQALETLFALVGEEAPQHKFSSEHKSDDITGVNVTGAGNYLPNKDQPTEQVIRDSTSKITEPFILDYQVDSQENDGLAGAKSFYGSRVSTIYKSNEGLYTEDLVAGEEGDLTASSYLNSPINRFTESTAQVLDGQHDGPKEVEDDCLRSGSVYQVPSTKKLAGEISGSVSPNSDTSIEADASDSISSDLNQVGINTCVDVCSGTKQQKPRNQCKKMANKQQPRQNEKKWRQPNGPNQKLNVPWKTRNVSSQNSTNEIVNAILNEYERQSKGGQSSFHQYQQHPRPYQNSGRNVYQKQMQNRSQNRAASVTTPFRSRHGLQNQMQEFSPKKEIVKQIQSGRRILVLLRGCPGSGKTTLAREIQCNGIILGTDNFFIINGEYCFDPFKLSEAHAFNKQCARQSMMQKRTPIIIDNTNLEDWEMWPYIVLAQRHQYDVYFLEPETFWRYNPKLLAQKNTHNIGYDKIVRMLERFDRNLTVDKMLQRTRTESLISDERMVQNEPGNVAKGRKSRSRSRHRQKSSQNQFPTENECSRDVGNAVTGSYSDELHDWRVPYNEGNSGKTEERRMNELWKSNSTPSLLMNEMFSRNMPCNQSLKSGEEKSEWGEISWATESPEAQMKFKKAGVDENEFVKKDLELSENMRDLMSIDFSSLHPTESVETQDNMPQDDPLKATTQPGQRRCRGKGLAASIGMTTSGQNWKMPAYPDSQTNDVNAVIPKSETTADMKCNLSLDDSGSVKKEEVVNEEAGEHFPENPLSALKSYFSTVPDDHLKDIYDKCNGDLQWVVDLLLESGYEMSPQTPSDDVLLQSGSSIEGLAEVNLDSNEIESDDTGRTNVPHTMQTFRSPDVNSSSKLSDEKPQDDERSFAVDTEDLVLRIDPVFAMQLQDMFGPAGFHLSPVSYYGSDLNVIITAEVARAIHDCWSKSLQGKFQAEEAELTKMLNDEDYAKCLQEEEDAKLAAALEPDPLGAHFPLLEEQKLSSLLQQEKVTPRTEDLAARIKRRQLYEMFPKIDKQALDEVFDANNACFADTVQAVEMSFCPDQKPQTIIAVEQLEEYEKALIKFAEQESLLLGLEQNKTPMDVAKNVQEPTYDDLRAEGSLHYQLRKECFAKAQNAYGKGLMSAASFYSQQGHVHTKKLNEANKRASEMILEIKNAHHRSDTLDLHMLHVQEALRALSEFIDRKKEEMQKSGCMFMKLRVITGRGNHSAMGIPKIMPAVLDFLVKYKYSHFDTGVGVIEVHLKNENTVSR